MSAILKSCVLFLSLLCITQTYADINMAPILARQKNNEVNIGMPILPTTLDPLNAWNTQHLIIIQSVFQTLVKLNSSNTITGDLAEQWKITNNGKTYTFYLNSKATFQNDTPVTAEDVAWSMSRHFWPDSGSNDAGDLMNILIGAKNALPGKTISGIALLDSHTIQFNLLAAYPPFLYILSEPGFSILPKQHFDGLHPIGSGPMQARFLADKQEWILKPYKNYTGAASQLNKITVSRVTDLADINQKIALGKLDLILFPPREEVFKTALPSTFQLALFNALGYSHLFFNISKSLWQQLALRKDLTLLIQPVFSDNRNLPAFYSFNPHYLPKGIMPANYYHNTLSALSPAEFKQKWHLKQPIVIVIQDGYYSQNMLDDIANRLQQAGVTVIWHSTDPEQYIQTLSRGNYDLIAGTFGADFNDPDGLLEPLRRSSPVNYNHFEDKTLFTALAKARFTADPNLRFKQYMAAFQTFEAQHYVISLFQVEIPFIANKKLVIPDLAYRYEGGELWKIYWQK